MRNRRPKQEARSCWREAARCFVFIRAYVPRNLGGRRGRYAAFEDRLLAVDDRHVGQRQLEDGRHQRQRRDVALVGTMELRTEPTHHLDVCVGDLLGCGLFHDGVLAHDVSQQLVQNTALSHTDR